MLRVVLVRPGATEFDEQKRIKGSLDMPLAEQGREQATQTAKDLERVQFGGIYSAPCESAQETAELLAAGRRCKTKVIDCFRNLDHGLWHGKLIDEVRRQLPRVYREGQESPENICPPCGETIDDARERIEGALRKIIRKHRDGAIAMVIPDPLASIVRSLLSGEELRDLWKSETDAGTWELIEPDQTAAKAHHLLV